MRSGRTEPSGRFRTTRRRRRAAAGAAALAVAGSLFAAAQPAGADSADQQERARSVDVQLLSFNDFHGNLEPPQGSSGEVAELQPDGSKKTVKAGGVEYLASSLRDAREGNPYSVTAAAGDLVGASPLVSGLFHDEPTVEAMNGLGLDVAGVGNHEFDEGIAELRRLQDGGNHPEDGGYKEGRTYGGADFPYLAANVTDEKTGKPALDPVHVWEKQGVKIGFIGVTLEATPDIVSAEGVKGLKFHDEIETIDKYAKQLRRQGVESIVALVHEGGYPAASAGGAYNYDCDTPGPGAGISGPVAEIAKGTTASVDAFVTGHTHQPYACTIPDPKGNPRSVTSASSFGRLYTDTTLTYDRRTGDIVRTATKLPDAENHVVDREQRRAPDMTSLVEEWNALAAPIAAKPVGHVSGDIPREGTESPLGDLIADAQLAHAKTLDEGARVALMNPGGIRAGITYAAAGDEGDGVVTYGEGFTVQPFSNTVNLTSLTGEQLLQVLREQVSGANEAAPKILQPSAGLTYTLDFTKSGADRIVADSVRLDGQPLDPAATYRVAVNSFLAGGGDGFPTLADGTDPLVGGDDLAALEGYLTANSSADKPLAPPAADRITVIGQQ
ncbi:bifunctional metallophosphatase/5'-nucleotidase [Streptomyces sp. NBC_01808]|uniref:bifunctional metallophosphatase/5'-nucleotidase n=1 Tax=Streptomyces sp. NBC_01808 TaxID=2975947 RepID=UPI003FA344F8